MTVYVDPMMTSLKSARWPYTKACHLFADTLEELHVFAASIGLRRRWFQNREDMPHYDLVGSKRRLAVKKGAEQVSLFFVVKRLQANRKARPGNE